MKALMLIVAVSLALVSSPVHAQDAPEEEFLRLEQEWTDALARQDSVLLASLLSPDFTLIGAGATTDHPLVDRATYLQNSMRVQWPRREVQILDVRRHGDAAVVRCVWRGKDPPPFQTPEPEAGIFEFLLTDVWVFGDDGWQVLARHSTFASVAR